MKTNLMNINPGILIIILSSIHQRIILEWRNQEIITLLRQPYKHLDVEIDGIMVLMYFVMDKILRWFLSKTVNLDILNIQISSSLE